MTKLRDENNNAVAKNDEPKAECTSCHWIAPVSEFLGDEPDQDSCPVCHLKWWSFV